MLLKFCYHPTQVNSVCSRIPKGHKCQTLGHPWPWSPKLTTNKNIVYVNFTDCMSIVTSSICVKSNQDSTFPQTQLIFPQFSQPNHEVGVRYSIEMTHRTPQFVKDQLARKISPV